MVPSLPRLRARPLSSDATDGPVQATRRRREPSPDRCGPNQLMLRRRQRVRRIDLWRRIGDGVYLFGWRLQVHSTRPQTVWSCPSARLLAGGYRARAHGPQLGGCVPQRFAGLSQFLVREGSCRAHPFPPLGCHRGLGDQRRERGGRHLWAHRAEARCNLRYEELQPRGGGARMVHRRRDACCRRSVRGSVRVPRGVLGRAVLARGVHRYCHSDPVVLHPEAAGTRRGERRPDVGSEWRPGRPTKCADAL